MNQDDDILALTKQEIDKLTDVEISDKDLKALEEVRKELDLLNVDELLKDLPKLEDIEFPNLDDLEFDLHIESE